MFDIDWCNLTLNYSIDLGLKVQGHHSFFQSLRNACQCIKHRHLSHVECLNTWGHETGWMPLRRGFVSQSPRSHCKTSGNCFWAITQVLPSKKNQVDRLRERMIPNIEFKGSSLRSQWISFIRMCHWNSQKHYKISFKSWSLALKMHSAILFLSTFSLWTGQVKLAFRVHLYSIKCYVYYFLLSYAWQYIM